MTRRKASFVWMCVTQNIAASGDETRVAKDSGRHGKLTEQLVQVHIVWILTVLHLALLSLLISVAGRRRRIDSHDF